MAIKTLYIGEKDRPVAFPAAAIREYERMTGQEFLRSNFMSYEFRIAIAYVGLKWGLYAGDGKEPKVDFNDIQVADWVGLEVHDESLNGQILAILNESLPKGKESKNEVAGKSPAA